MELSDKKLIEAARKADWEQVVLNGGPPCFHLDDDGSFCFRAERWAGHGVMHAYKPLHELVAAVATPPIAAQADRREPPIEFVEWLCREMPAGTEIGNPGWWAPRIWRAVRRAMSSPLRIEGDGVPACKRKCCPDPQWCGRAGVCLNVPTRDGVAAPHQPKQWLWRVFNLGFPPGHEDSSNEWGNWSGISEADAVRLAGEDEHGNYQFVPFQPASPAGVLGTHKDQP